MPEENKSLSSKTTTTISLLALMKIIVTVFSVLSIFVLAKLLTPEDFGLVAMASILAVALQQALQIPVNQVLILIDEPSRERLQHSIHTECNSRFDYAFTASGLSLSHEHFLW